MALDSPGRPRMDPGSPRRPWVVARRLRPAPDDHLDGHLDDDLDDHLGDHLDDHLYDHLDDHADGHLNDHQLRHRASEKFALNFV